MAASYLDYFIHAANVLLLLAYSVRDILWLRLLERGAMNGPRSIHDIDFDKLTSRKFTPSPDQASVIWFGSTGAEYAPANAMFSDKNLITATPLVGVDDAIGLLRRSIKKE